MTGSGATPSGPTRPDGSSIAPDDVEWCAGCEQKHSKCECAPSGQETHGPWCNGYLIGACDCATRPTPPAPAQEAGIDSSLIAAHDVTADQTPQEAGSGRHVQSAARNLTSGPGMSSELDGGRQAAVEAVAQKLAEWTASHRYWIKAGEAEREAYRDDARELLDLPAVAALSQPGEPT